MVVDFLVVENNIVQRGPVGDPSAVWSVIILSVVRSHPQFSLASSPLPEHAPWPRHLLSHSASQIPTQYPMHANTNNHDDENELPTHVSSEFYLGLPLGPSFFECIFIFVTAKLSRFYQIDSRNIFEQLQKNIPQSTFVISAKSLLRRWRRRIRNLKQWCR